jgi:hypothetical protein
MKINNSNIKTINSSLNRGLNKCLLATRFQAGFLLGLFDLEDGGDMFLRNVS